MFILNICYRMHYNDDRVEVSNWVVEIGERAKSGDPDSLLEQLEEDANQYTNDLLCWVEDPGADFKQIDIISTSIFSAPS